MRIGIFPGTFDPVHFGHIYIVKMVIKEYHLDRIIIIPAGCTPNKGRISDSKPNQRWSVLSKAFETEESVIACSLEINVQDCSYTYDTIVNIRKMFPNDDLFLVIGEDVYQSFKLWYRSDLIQSLTNLIVIRRKNAPFTCEENPNIYVAGQVSECSSTYLRNASNTAIPLSGSIPADCEYVVHSFGMYLDDRLIKEIDYVKRHQKSSRFFHTLGVVKSSLDLAERLGFKDRMSVLESALLHDIAKELPFDISYKLTANCACDLGRTDIAPVIHAPAGAELAKRLFNIPDTIYQAILLHCTLDSNMTILDMIVYISDMVEPSRAYPAVNELRTYFNRVHTQTDLNNLVMLALKRNICYISSTGGTVHPASERALAFLNKLY